MATADYEHGYEDDRFNLAVGSNFHCAICLNVLNDPVACQNNQHCFCRPCITRHLQNSNTCPTCMEQLSLETLTPPPRIFRASWSELNIDCDFFDQGCRELVQLGDLQAHVASCGFAPVVCSNEGCLVEINRREQTYHETERCEFRILTCRNCHETRQEIGEMKRQMTGIQEQLAILSDQIIRGVQMTEGKENIVKSYVVVAGGWGDTGTLNSAEVFNVSKSSWTPLQSMNEPRSGASSFVFENEIVVTGGYTGSDWTDSTEKLNIDSLKNSQPWVSFPAKLPSKLAGHSSVLHDAERLIVIGGRDGRNVCDSIHEVFLEPPYPATLLTRMPQRRWLHSAQLVGDNKIMIFGGTGVSSGYSVNDVISYDIAENKFKRVSRLPYAVCGMATAKLGENVIVAGGCDKDGSTLNSVIIYNVKTGNRHMLPYMKYKRRQCVAVSVENSIIVVGGQDEKLNVLKSVEKFSFDSYSWEELPPMNEARCSSTAVVC